jgi:hypothetical protein
VGRLRARKLIDSNFLRADFFVRLALGHDSGAQPVTQIVGQFVQLGIAVNFNGFLGGIANDIAVVAPSQVILQFSFGAVVEDTVQVVCQFL